MTPSSGITVAPGKLKRMGALLTFLNSVGAVFNRESETLHSISDLHKMAYTPWSHLVKAYPQYGQLGLEKYEWVQEIDTAWHDVKNAQSKGNRQIHFPVSWFYEVIARNVLSIKGPRDFSKLMAIREQLLAADDALDRSFINWHEYPNELKKPSSKLLQQIPLTEEESSEQLLSYLDRKLSPALSRLILDIDRQIAFIAPEL